jgi:predicted permease
MDSLLQDLRFGFRTLLKKPLLIAVALITLSLGIGANTTIFSVVNAVLLRKLPYNNPDQLIMIGETNPQGIDNIEVSYPNFTDLKEQSQAFEKIAAYRTINLILTGAGEAERINTAFVTDDLFELLQVRPARGRVFTPEDKGNQVVVSHGFWQRRFGSDPGLIGGSITLNSSSCTVIGIMPAGFQFPNEKIEVWLPLSQLAGQMKNRSVHVIAVIARLKPDLSLRQAQTDIEAIAGRIQQNYSGEDPGHGFKAVSLREQVVGYARPKLMLLLGVVSFVLLIACSNVANLMLSKAAARQQEMAIRAALGASRWRIIRLLLSESILLAFIGGLAGLLLSVWGIDFLSFYLSENLPRASEIGIDRQVLAFTLLISTLSGLLFGLAPAIKASKDGLNESLKIGSSTSIGGPQRNRFSKALIISEIALSLILLAGAGLLIKSFWRLLQVDPGFKSENLLTMTISLTGVKYRETDQIVSFYKQLPLQLETIPGVRAVSAVSALPISGGDGVGDLTIDGRAFPPGEKPAASFRRILPNYFKTMEISLVRGREFDDRDNGEDQKVVIINDSMARRFWPGEDAVGKRLKVGPPENEPWLTVVGVVKDVRNIGLDAEPNLATYEPHPQRPWSTMNLVVRTEGDPLKLSAAVREEISKIDKDLPVYNVTTMNRRISASVGDRRINMVLLSIFAAISLLLAVVGIYGVMSYFVTRQIREFGVRMALGAQPSDIFRIVFGHGAVLILSGLAVGLVGSFVLTRTLSNFLFDMSANDPLTFVSVSIILSLAALFAIYIPARKATRIDPVTALRYE